MPQLKPTILLVDNDPDLVRALALRLESRGFRCLTAGTGGQALAAFSLGGIDLVITDLNMPGGDGLELTNALRRTSTVPIIVVTGYKNDFARRLRGVPNVVLLHKPFEVAELMNLVDAELLLHSQGQSSAQKGEKDL